MRRQSVFLLVLAAALAVADVSVATSHTRAHLVDQNDASAKRLLRSVAEVGDGEERAGGTWMQSLTNLLKTNTKTAPKALTKIEYENPEVAKLVGKSLNGAFKSLKLNNIKSVDDLFASKNFETFYGFMLYSNSQGLNKPSTVPKFFSKKLGDKKAAELFAQAAASSNAKVKNMGKSYQAQLLLQWGKEGKTLQQVVKIDASLQSGYKKVLKDLALSAQKKAEQLAKAEAAKAKAAADAAT
ncbi:hypothetical protein V7S43_016830 [Phytophthora oleae]|uniref:RxLR effector protein n=1 Tax=Phytophthora oleae TaxID=2107226 RepID=A0ABD3EUK9_9STRA